ncbi:MAG: cation transporter, partial [archaeon]
MKKIELGISGMHCSSCANNIESSFKSRKAIISAKVNLTTENAVIEFNEKLISLGEIKKEIANLGYKVIDLENETDSLKNTREEERQKEIKNLKKLFVLSLVFFVPIFIISMPFMWLGIEIPNTNLILLVLATPIQFIVGYRFYKGAYFAIKNKKANMDVLIALSTSAAYFYSLFVVIFPQKLIGNVYFDSSAAIITFIILGKLLESLSKGKASEAIRKLMDLSPKIATVIRNKKEEKISIKDLVIGDIIVV